MTGRIVLSALLLAGLCVSACDVTANGIGTSPSADDIAETATPLADVQPPACGVWVRASADLADQASLAGEPPDIVAYASGYTTCSDAVTIASERYPGRAFVRRVKQAFRAYEAP